LLDRFIERGSPFIHYDLRLHLDSKARYEVRRERKAPGGDTENGPGDSASSAAY
jgi:hypothetical protein